MPSKSYNFSYEDKNVFVRRNFGIDDDDDCCISDNLFFFFVLLIDSDIIVGNISIDVDKEEEFDTI